MIVGTGVDLCEVGRIRDAIGRSGDLFLRRVFTAGEIETVGHAAANRFERYAARFAAKEAGMKAVGTGWQSGVTWRDFEVVTEADGRPVLLLHGVAADLARRRAVARIHISLSHTAGMAIASVILESD